MKLDALRVLGATLIVVSATFVLFSGTIGYGYLNWDDDIYVYDNEKIRSISAENIVWWFTNPYYYSYIPVTMLSHSLDHLLWGNAPRGHHLTNTVLHSLNAGILFLFGLLLVQILKSRNGAEERSLSGAGVGTVIAMASAALLFSLHPLRAESVAWVSDRKDLLCLFFLLLAGMAYLLSHSDVVSKGGARLRLASLILFLCAVLSKGIAAVFPAVLIVTDWLLYSREDRKNRWQSLLRQKAPFIIVSVVILVVYLALIEPGGKLTYAAQQLSGLDHVFFAFYSFSFYLIKLVVPVSLSPLYSAASKSELIIGTLLFVVVTGAAALAAVRNHRGILAGWIIYILFVLPTVLGLSSGMQAQADRFTYLASVPLFLLAGSGLSLLLENGSGIFRRAVTAVMVLLLLLLGWQTFRQLEIWRSSQHLWEYVVHNFPPKPDYMDAYVNLGEAYTAEWELPEARKVFETAVTIDSTNGDALYGLGYVVYLQGEWDRAAELFTRLTTLDPTHAKGFFGLAVVMSQLNRDDIAIPAMQRSAMLGSKDALDALRDAGIPLQEGDETSIPLDRN